MAWKIASILFYSILAFTQAFQNAPTTQFGQRKLRLIRHEHIKNARISSLLPSQSSSIVNSIDTDDDKKATTPIKIPKLSYERYSKTYTWKNPISSLTHKINYRTAGSPKNPPLLLIHGFGANVNHFRYNIPALVDAGYYVHAIDLLGFGGSDKSKEEDYCIELWVDLICDFIQDRNYDYEKTNKTSMQQEDKRKWIVCGNSIGGLCSLGTAHQIPELVKAVTLFNCAGGMTGFRYEEIPLLLKPILAPLLYFLQKVVLSPTGYGSKFFDDFKTPENVETILLKQGVYGDVSNVDSELMQILLDPSEDDGAKEVFLKVFGGPAGPTPENLLPEIECPILALWGSDDPWTPVNKGMHPGGNFGDYAKGDFELIILDGAGHCPHE